jgi:hypothetical protein
MTGLRDCLVAPGWGAFAAMAGFGAIAGQADVSLSVAWTLLFGLWSMPGQVAYLELHDTGIGPIALIGAVTVANIRMLPLTIASIPLLRDGGGVRPADFLLAQLNSVTAYVQLADMAERIPDRPRRARHFLGFCVGTLILTGPATAIGYVLARSLPIIPLQAMVFLAPLYVLLLAGRSGKANVIISVAAGALLVPIAHLVSPAWGIVGGGTLAGSIAFLVTRKRT